MKLELEQQESGSIVNWDKKSYSKYCEKAIGKHKRVKTTGLTQYVGSYTKEEKARDRSLLDTKYIDNLVRYRIRQREISNILRYEKGKYLENMLIRISRKIIIITK